MQYDEIGPWSLVKLEIVRDYARRYSTILTAQRDPPLQHVYIDAFAGAGIHTAKGTEQFVPGSPLNALLVKPPFREYFFIDLNPRKVGYLRSLVGERPDVHVFEGDCNTVLLKRVFPQVQFGSYRRGLCLLDPYGLHLDWAVVEKAGQMRSLELFVNFPILDMNRNVLHRAPGQVAQRQAARMTAFWGDDSWRQLAYRPSRQVGLFADSIEEKTSVGVLVQGYQDRLRRLAGFEYVPDPMPMRNSTGGLLYYLFFASHKPVAQDIVMHIFAKYGRRR